MLNDIVDVVVVKDYVLRLTFENGQEGEVDVAQIIPFEGIFAELKDPNTFASVKIDDELGTIVWNNGADLSPSFLYSIIAKKL